MLTKEELTKYLKEAKEVVDAVGFEEPEEKAAALTKTLELLTRKVENLTQNSEPHKEQDGDDFFTLLSQKLGVEVLLLRKVFYKKEDDVSVLVRRGDLSKAKRSATREVALLIAAARQQAGLENETSTLIIKDLCDKTYRCYDQTNFSTHIASLRDIMHIRKENSRTKFLTVAEPGYEELKILLERITNKK